MHVFVLVLVLLDPDWVFHLELGLSIAALGASARWFFLTLIMTLTAVSISYL